MTKLVISSESRKALEAHPQVQRLTAYVLFKNGQFSRRCFLTFHRDIRPWEFRASVMRKVWDKHTCQQVKLYNPAVNATICVRSSDVVS